MERWCPRCEWVGTAKGRAAACPACGALLLEVEGARSRRPRSQPSPPSTPAGSPPDAGHPTSAGGAQDGILRPRGGLVGPWGRVAVTATVILLVAGVVVGARALRSSPSPVRARSAPQPPRLPARLAYLVSGLEGGPGGRLYFAPGDGGRFPAKDTHGTALPSDRASDLGREGTVPASAGTRSATWFDWSPDGERVSVLGADQGLRLVPGQRLLGRPVVSSEFAPDGRRVAFCTAGTRSPRILIRDVDGRGGGRPPPEVAGCDPVWSPDGSFVAYRNVRSGGGLSTRSFGLLDLRRRTTIRNPWRWPVAWTPRPGPDALALTAVSPAGDAVFRVDTSGRLAQVLISAFTLRRLADDRPVGPIDALAWSNDGRLLAVGLGRRPGAVAGLAVLDADLGTGSFFEWPTGPSFLSWAGRDGLLAEFDRPGSKAAMEIAGTRLVARLPGVSSVSWSPDGRWILGRTASGWTAIDAARPSRRLPIGLDSSGWSLARWCCPAVRVVRTVPQP